MENVIIETIVKNGDNGYVGICNRIPNNMGCQTNVITLHYV